MDAGIQLRRLVFGPRLAPPQVVQANVRHDAVEPGIEAALEAETVKIAVNLEESFLVNVPCILGAFHPIERQAQDVAVVPAHPFLATSAAPRLRVHPTG